MKLKPITSASYMGTRRKIKTTIPQKNILGIALLRSIHERIHTANKSYLAFFAGEHRSAKSTTAFTWATIIDKTFFTQSSERMPDNAKQFAKAVKSIKEQNVKGAVIIIDEAGATMATSDWYEHWMKEIVKAIQEIGFLNPIIFFCSLSSDFLNSPIRKMLNAYFKVSKSNNKVYITPYELKYSTIRRKYYYRHTRGFLFGRKLIISRVFQSKPPKEIIDRYEEIAGYNRKSKHIDKRFDEILKEEKEKPSIEEIIKHVIENHTIYISPKSKEYETKLDRWRIRRKWGLTINDARYVQEEAQVKIDEIKDKEKQKKEEEHKKKVKEHMKQIEKSDVIV